MYSALRFEKAEAIFLERQLQIIEQLPDFAFEIVDQVLMNQMMNAARKNLIEVPHQAEILLILGRQMRVAGAEVQTLMEILSVIGEAAIHRIAPSVDDLRIRQNRVN